MNDRLIEFQSKMLIAFFKAFKVEPSVHGVITAMGGEPDKVFEMVRYVQENGERITKTLESAVTNTAARVERIEAELLVQRQMLQAISEREGVIPRVLNVSGYELRDVENEGGYKQRLLVAVTHQAAE